MGAGSSAASAAEGAGAAATGQAQEAAAGTRTPPLPLSVDTEVVGDFELKVVTVARLPFCTLRVRRSTEIAKLLKQVSKVARLAAHALNLSHAGEKLDAAGTVASYGLLPGNVLMLHVKSSADGGQAGSVTTPGFTFGGAGAALRLRVNADFERHNRKTLYIEALVDTTVEALLLQAAQHVQLSAHTLALCWHGEPLRPDRSLGWHKLTADEILTLRRVEIPTPDDPLEPPRQQQLSLSRRRSARLAAAIGAATQQAEGVASGACGNLDHIPTEGAAMEKARGGGEGAGEVHWRWAAGVRKEDTKTQRANEGGEEASAADAAGRGEDRLVRSVPLEGGVGTLQLDDGTGRLQQLEEWGKETARRAKEARRKARSAELALRELEERTKVQCGSVRAEVQCGSVRWCSVVA